MRSTEPGTTCIVPPPGPLAWLHPELIQASQRPAGPDGRSGETPAAPPVDELLDLGRSGCSGKPLVDALAERRAVRIIIEDGPRGHSFWSWLSQSARDTAIDVCRPSPAPPPFPGNGRSRPLESLLTAAADRTGRGEAVIVEHRPEGRYRFRTAGLDVLPRASYLAAGAEDPTTLRLLPFRPGDGLEQQLVMALDVVSRDVASCRQAGIIPYFVTGSVPGDPPLEPQPDTGRTRSGGRVETRLLPSWWGVLPGDSYPRPVRELYRELFRLLCPDRMFLFLALENYALAGIDLYRDSLVHRCTTMAPPPPATVTGSTGAAGTPDSPRGGRKGKPLIIGVCGIDGAGKSSHVAALEKDLSERGLRTSVQKIYRHGVFHDTVTELTRQCAGDRNLHLWRIQRIAKAFDSVKYFYAAVEKDLASCDAVIFDRYVFTHFAAGVGRYHYDPFTRELLAVFPPADRIYLLDVPTEEALRRIGTRDARTVDENPYMLSRYRHALLDLAQRFGFLVLDGRKSFEENSRIILQDTARLVESGNGTP